MSGKGERRLLALASKERLVKILEKMLDESEFFSDHGIRSCVFLFHGPLLIFKAVCCQIVEVARTISLGYGCSRTAL